MSVWRPTPGDMIQCWDYSTVDEHSGKLSEHGKVGYVVGESKKTDTYKDSKGVEHKLNHIKEGTCFKCIFFTESGHDIVHVNQNWLRKIEKSSDIKRVEEIIKE